jgi:hypothetical protein
MTQIALTVLPVFLGTLLPLAFVLLHRRRQARCSHMDVAMDPTGRSLCLKCWKRNPR